MRLPLAFILRDISVDIDEALASFLQRVLNILEDDTLNRAVVNLAELVI